MNNPPSEKNRRVLVIDDNRAIHDDFRKILCPANGTSVALDATEAAVFGPATEVVWQARFEVDSAYQGEEGVLCVRQALEEGRPYAMAFVDVRMPPGLDGVETTRKIWELDPDLQIVLCTAYSDYSWGEMFEKLGQSDGLLILKKPFDSVEALQLAHALTEKWWLHQQSRRKMEDLEGMVAGRTRELQQTNHALQAKIVEHQRAEESLRKSENQFHTLAKLSPVGIFRTDANDMVIYWNEKLCSLTGMTVEEALGTGWINGIHPEDRQRVFTEWGKSVRERLPFKTQYRFIHKDGSVVWTIGEAAAIVDEADGVTGYVGTITDISELKLAEAALRESETRYRALFDGSADGIVIADVETKAFKYANPAMCRMLGYTEAELRTLGVRDIHPKDDLPNVMAEFEAQARGDKTLANLPCLRKDGSVFPADINATKVTIDGRPCNVGFFRDITERKQAEAASMRLAAIVESSADAIIGKDLDGVVTSWNRGAEKLFGYKASEMVGASIMPLIPAARQDEEEKILKKLKRGESVEQFETVRQTKEGRLIDVAVTVSPVKDVSGRVIGISKTARDITDRKQAEEALRMFQFASDNAADEVFWLDPNAGFYYVNDQACRSLGYTREELMRLSVFDIDPIFSKERWDEAWRKFQTGQIEIFRTESSHRRKDGSVFPVEVMSKHLCFGDMRLNLALTRDITERKRMEAELTYERDLLRTLLDQSPDDIYFKDAQSRFIKASQTMARLCKVASPEEMVGKTDFDFFAEAHARPAFEDEQEIIRTGVPVIGKVEKEVWLDGRKETWVLTTKMPFRDKDGKIIGTFGVSKDITALKQIEQALAYERDLLKTLMDSSVDTIYFKDLQSRFVRMSRSKAEKNFAMELARHAAAHPDEDADRRPAHLASLERFTEYLPGRTDFDFFPEDMAREALEEEQEIIRSGMPLRDKLGRSLLADGQLGWFIINKLAWRDQDGKIIGTFGVSKDITAMKQAEAKLAHEQARLQFIFESMPVGVALARQYPDGRFERIINDAHLRICGLTREQDQSPETYQQITHPDDRARQTELHSQLDHDPQCRFSLEKRYLRPDGEVVWVVYSFQRNHHADGCTEELTTVVDITGLKQAEESLRASEERMRLQTTALESTANGVVITDREGTIQWVNAAFTQLTGYSVEEAIGGNPRILKSGQHPDAFYKELWETISRDRAWKGELINRRKDGLLYHEEMTITPVRDVSGAITHFVAIKQDITERKRAEAELEKLHKQLLETSRQAGMAEVATSVLHNVGNVLNSVNISCSVVSAKVRKSQIGSVAKTAALLQEHAADPVAFFTGDPTGRKLPDYLGKLAARLADEQQEVLRELQLLGRNIDHIKEIVAMQQSHAKVSGIAESVNATDLIEESLRMNDASLTRHEVRVVRDYAEVPMLTVEKHKALQILVNLIRNAKHSCEESQRADKQITVRLSTGQDRVRVAVIDNGMGIPPENLTRIFAHGFTTKASGHGFGLHSGALAAREMGGALAVHSGGMGQGATFTLELPYKTPFAGRRNDDGRRP